MYSVGRLAILARTPSPPPPNESCSFQGRQKTFATTPYVMGAKYTAQGESAVFLLGAKYRVRVGGFD